MFFCRLSLSLERNKRLPLCVGCYYQMVYKGMHDTSCCVPSLFGVQNPGVSDPPPIEAGYEERRNQHAHQEPGYCLGSQLTEVSSGVWNQTKYGEQEGMHVSGSSRGEHVYMGVFNSQKLRPKLVLLGNVWAFFHLLDICSIYRSSISLIYISVPEGLGYLHCQMHFFI